MEKDTLRELDASPRAEPDSWLRERLEPPRDVVRRAVRQALEGDIVHVMPAPLLVVAGLGLALLVVVALIERGRDGGGLALPTLTNASGPVVLVLPDAESQAAVNVSNCPEIFNRGSVVVAIVPGARSEFLIAGGGS